MNLKYLKPLKAESPPIPQKTNLKVSGDLDLNKYLGSGFEGIEAFHAFLEEEEERLMKEYEEENEEPFDLQAWIKKYHEKIPTKPSSVKNLSQAPNSPSTEPPPIPPKPRTTNPELVGLGMEKINGMDPIETFHAFLEDQER